MIKKLSYLLLLISSISCGHLHEHYLTTSFSELRQGSFPSKKIIASTTRFNPIKKEIFSIAKESPPLVVDFGDARFAKKYPTLADKKVAFFQTKDQRIIALDLASYSILWERNVSLSKDKSFANMHIDNETMLIYGSHLKGVYSLSLDGKSFAENNFFDEKDDRGDKRYTCRPSGVVDLQSSSYYLACTRLTFFRGIDGFISYAQKGDQGISSGVVFKVELDTSGSVSLNGKATPFYTAPKSDDPFSGYNAGIYMSAGGMAKVNDQLIFSVGNGSYIPSLKNFASSLLKLSTNFEEVEHIPTILPRSMEALVQNIDFSSAPPALIKMPNGTFGATLTKDGWLRIFDSDHFEKGFLDRYLISAIGNYSQVTMTAIDDENFEIIVLAPVGRINVIGDDRTIIPESILNAQNRKFKLKRCLGYLKKANDSNDLALIYSGYNDNNYLVVDKAGGDIFTSLEWPSFVQQVPYWGQFWNAYIPFGNYELLSDVQSDWLQSGFAISKYSRSIIRSTKYPSNYYVPNYSFAWTPLYLLSEKEREESVYSSNSAVITIHKEDLKQLKTTMQSYECKHRAPKDYEALFDVHFEPYRDEEEIDWALHSFKVSTKTLKLEHNWQMTGTEEVYPARAHVISSYNPDRPSKGYVFASFDYGLENMALWVVDRSNRSIVKKVIVPGKMHFSQPLVIDNKLFVATSKGLHLFEID